MIIVGERVCCFETLRARLEGSTFNNPLDKHHLYPKKKYRNSHCKLDTGI